MQNIVPTYLYLIINESSQIKIITVLLFFYNNKNIIIGLKKRYF